MYDVKMSKQILALLLAVVAITGEIPVQYAEQLSYDAGGMLDSKPVSAIETEQNVIIGNPLRLQRGVTAWHCVYFGNYWQYDTNGDGMANKEDEKRPIKWRVMSVDGDNALLMSDKILDTKPYHVDAGCTAWDASSLRSWLNGYGADENSADISYIDNSFMDAAFSEEEKAVIMDTTVTNGYGEECPDDNAEEEIKTTEEINTTDKVFLLSLEDSVNLEYGFNYYQKKWKTNSYTREAAYTEYAMEQGAEYVYSVDYKRSGTQWWLRTPVDTKGTAPSVRLGMACYGMDKVDEACGIRPVLRVDLSNTVLWEYAGMVSSGAYEDTERASEIDAFPTPFPMVEPTTAPDSGTQPLPPNRQLRNPICSKYGVSTWDCIWFGKYWQNDTNWTGVADKLDKKEPIKWRVLSVDGNDAFLLADKCLECIPYNKTNTNITWEYSTIRSWLNSYDASYNKEETDYTEHGFLKEAFSLNERDAIYESYVKNEDNLIHGTPGGEDTLDKIYCLSAFEAGNIAYGFWHVTGESTMALISQVTPYAIFGGGSISASDDRMFVWWLRSVGGFSSNAMYITQKGKWHIGDLSDEGFDYSGISVEYRSFVCSVASGRLLYSACARPVLHLDISKTDVWSYAGTVTSDNQVEEHRVSHVYATEEPGLPSPTALPSATEEPGLPSPTALPSATEEPGLPSPTALPSATEEPALPSPTLPVTVSAPSVSSVMPSLTETASQEGGQIFHLSNAYKFFLYQNVKGTKICVRWKKVPVKHSTYVEIYRSTKKYAGYKRIARVSVKKNSYTDKKVKRNVTYYYKLRYTGSVNGKYVSSGYTKQKKFTVYGLKTPKIKIKKKRTGTGINYLEIRLQRANGTYLELYVKRKGKYRRVKLASERRAYYHGIIRVQYAVKGKMYLRIRTGKKVRKKKRWSPWSNVVGVK